MIANNSSHINQSIDSADVFLTNMAKVSKDLPSVVKDLQSGVGKFGTMADDISQTMLAGKTTVNKISQQTLPEAAILLRRLNAIAANLEKVSNEMRQNPSVVIRGTTPPKPGPGE